MGYVKAQGLSSNGWDPVFFACQNQCQAGDTLD